jgi:hypothetical protein|tara:strand:- start:70 stop:396 length:327 start_codon:yes stop_codon:yes gene_type:complete
MDNEKIASELVKLAYDMLDSGLGELEVDREDLYKIQLRREFDADIESIGRDFRKAIKKVKNPYDIASKLKLYEKYKDIGKRPRDVLRAITTEVDKAKSGWLLPSSFLK